MEHNINHNLDIKYDQKEISLNTLLKNNYLDLKPSEPVEDLNDRLIENLNNTDNNNIIDPIKTQQQKELDILNY